MGCSRGSLVVAGLLVWAVNAAAQAPTESAAVARELFDQGRALLAEKNYARACPKFEEAQRLDPGGGTLLNLALCNELRGKIATAWAQFDEALRWARRDGRADREQFALEHRAALEPRLGRLVVVLERDARVAGLSVSRDGVPVGEGSLGEALPVDAGEHTVEARAPGRRPFRLTVRVRDGAVTTVTVPALAGGESARRPPPAAPPRSRAGDASATWGTVLVGVGAGTVFAGGVYFARALDYRAEADRLCPESQCRRADGPYAVALNEEAQQAARISTLLVATGLGVAGLGGYLILTSGSGDAASGIAVGGKF